MNEVELTKLQKILIWSSIIALWGGVAFIVWLALQLKGVVG